MSHPFGDLVTQHLSRRHGLSQNKLAQGVDQDPAVISAMCNGRRLSGRQARERVLAMIGWFVEQGVLDTHVEAGALLEAAGMARLHPDRPAEAALLGAFPLCPPPPGSLPIETASQRPAPVPHRRMPWTAILVVVAR